MSLLPQFYNQEGEQKKQSGVSTGEMKETRDFNEDQHDITNTTIRYVPNRL